MKTKHTYFLLPLALLAYATHLSADILAQDQFEYTVDDPLNAANGGTGWSGGWNAVDSGTTTHVTVETNNGSSAAHFAGSDPNAKNFAYRPFGSTLDQDTLYVSYLFEFESDGNFFALWLDDTTSTSNNHSNVVPNTGLFTSGDLFARFVGTGEITGPTAVSGTPYQLVIEVSKSTPGVTEDYTNIRFWVNPENSDLGTPTGTNYTNESTSRSSYDYVGFRGAGNADGDSFWVDDLIIATEWDDVVVIPEPSTVALVLVALVGIAPFLRRRSRRS
ncbi:MAG: PEP-CTERM sorting domain-containing protein [Kiritimatiellae bacterium]|jgi:hypothetical protein|nr:PEP-CTERM sorting domain-containing protein [Kiritimatiellia bacterium]